MSKYDLTVGDEVTTIDGSPSRTYIIINYKPGDNWAIVITRADGWHYALRANELIPTGQHYNFSEKLKREIDESMQSRYNIPKMFLTDQHLILVTT